MFGVEILMFDNERLMMAWLTCVYGPCSEEARVLIATPAVSGRVLPGDFHDLPVLVQPAQSVYRLRLDHPDQPVSKSESFHGKNTAICCRHQRAGGAAVQQRAVGGQHRLGAGDSHWCSEEWIAWVGSELGWVVCWRGENGGASAWVFCCRWIGHDKPRHRLVWDRRITISPATNGNTEHNPIYFFTNRLNRH